MKQLIAAIAFGLTAASQAFAHGAPPKHGGVVSHAADLAFELVARDGKAVIYVEDHGRPLPTRGASGTLTVLQGKHKSETVLAPAGANELVSGAGVTLVKGTKAVASLTLAGKEPIRVRFSVK